MGYQNILGYNGSMYGGSPESTAIEFIMPPTEEVKDDIPVLPMTGNHIIPSLNTTPSKEINPLVLFIIIIVVYISFAFWGESTKSFLSYMFNKNRPFNWVDMLLYAIFISMIFMLLIWITGISLLSFENVG